MPRRCVTWRGHVLRFLAATVLIYGAVGVFMTSVSVATETASACGSSQTEQGAGMDNGSPPAGGFLGVEGAINHYNPRLCTGTYSVDPTSSDWIMEYNDTGSNETNFVQDGFLKWAPDGNYPQDVHNYFFWECTPCKNVGGVSLPSTPVDFQEVTDISDENYTDFFGVFQDGSDSADTILDVQPLSDPGLNTELSLTVVLNFKVGEASVTPNALALSGEVHDYESQMPGDLDTDVQLSALEYLRTSGWANTDLNSGYWSPFNGTYGYSTIVTGTDLAIYDLRYTCETGAC